MSRPTYAPPQQPDMKADGTPNITVLRTSRARQVNYHTTLDDPTISLSHAPTHSVRQKLWGRAAKGILRHWAPLGAGFLLVIVLYVGYTQWVLPTWNTLQAQWHTGDGRVIQFDADVGHGGMSHFLAQYYDGHIVIIEFPLSSPTHIHTYTVLALTQSTKQQDLKIMVQDVNHDGRPDMVIQEGDNSMAIILYNTGTGFSETER